MAIGMAPETEEAKDAKNASNAAAIRDIDSGQQIRKDKEVKSAVLSLPFLSYGLLYQQRHIRGSYSKRLEASMVQNQPLYVLQHLAPRIFSIP